MHPGLDRIKDRTEQALLALPAIAPPIERHGTRGSERVLRNPALVRGSGSDCRSPLG